MFVDSRPEDRLLAVAEEILVRVKELERMGNCHDPASDLARLNADPSHEIPDELRLVLDACGSYREQTLGLFDPWFEGRCNLSGFLKGYALDQIAPMVKEHGIKDALVNMGNSSVMAVGCQPGCTDGWLVSRALPAVDGHEGVLLCDECLSTSGNDSPSRRHIVNPLTHELIGGQRTVSVVTPRGALGEVLSTALFVATDGQREQLLRRFSEARLIDL